MNTNAPLLALCLLMLFVATASAETSRQETWPIAMPLNFSGPQTQAQVAETRLNDLDYREMVLCKASHTHDLDGIGMHGVRFEPGSMTLTANRSYLGTLSQLACQNGSDGSRSLVAQANTARADSLTRVAMRMPGFAVRR